MPDFTVAYHGSLCLVAPLTNECREWLEENVGDESQWFGGALVVEPRYLDNLVTGLIEDGGFVS
jgi:hypothetical protein